MLGATPRAAQRLSRAVASVQAPACSSWISLLPALQQAFGTSSTLAAAANASPASGVSAAAGAAAGAGTSAAGTAPHTGSSREPYDVCVVGAGMVGAALVALLHANPLTASMRLALIDQQAPPMTLTQPQYPDLRVSTITPANMQLLQQAGAWQELAAAAPTFQHMQVWEFAGPGCINWQSADVGLPYMGCVVENRMLQAALLRAATAVSSGSSGSSGGGCLDMLCPASVKGLRLPGSSNAGTSSSSNQPLSQQLAAAGSSSAASSSSSSSSSSSLAELELADGSKLQCRLIVAADGARSRVRELAGFRTVGWSYNQRGLVATVATSEPNDTAWQRFLPTGPLALLPVRDGYSNVVWTVTPEMAKRLEAASSSEFAAAVNEALQQAPGCLGGSVSTRAAGAAASGPVAAAGAVLQGLGGALSSAPLVGQLLGGAVSSLGGAAAEAGSSGSSSSSSSWRAPPLVQGWAGTSPKSFPLQMQHSGRYVGPRLALIGDAAHAVHPLAGQGVNLGLGDAAALAQTLAFARKVGQDVGDVGLLQARYESQQQRVNLGMMTALEVLWRGFGVQQGLVGAVRSAGLGALNSLGPLKNGIMKYAMGLSSNLP